MKFFCFFIKNNYEIQQIFKISEKILSENDIKSYMSKNQQFN